MIPEAPEAPATFSIAVVPDIQNYTSHRNQTEAGFPFNAREMLYDMMSHIVRNAVTKGGDIVFATGLGDLWLHHSSSEMDSEHSARGERSIPNPILERLLPPAPGSVVDVEIPIAKAAWEIVAAELPFSVVPGNHDYDHWWTDASIAPDEARFESGDLAGVGSLHCGSLKNWTANFGSESAFFKGKPWYVAAFREGINSAQIFQGGGYRFLHLGLEMAPDEPVILWAEHILKAFPGIPVIISIHEFIDSHGQRKPLDCFNLTRLDPYRYDPQQLWERFVSQHDQILCVLNGHFHGVRHRVDKNKSGHDVYQLLSNYQGRKQTLLDVSPDTYVFDGVGDGWLRLMQFDLNEQRPCLRIKTYSTHYKMFSSGMPQYGDIYGEEHPGMSQEEIAAFDDLEFQLIDFHQRFPNARLNSAGAPMPGGGKK